MAVLIKYISRHVFFTLYFAYCMPQLIASKVVSKIMFQVVCLGSIGNTGRRKGRWQDGNVGTTEIQPKPLLTRVWSAKSIHTTWGLTWNSDSQAPPHVSESESVILQDSRWFMWTFSSDRSKHWSKPPRS